MVHCPQCGAANPDESKLCSECGSVLPGQGNGVRCPMCSHSNPAGRETCEQCNARLVPLVAPSPLQEPPDSVEAGPPPLPTFTPEGVQPAEAAATPEDELEQGRPDWLRRMRDSALSGEPSADDVAAEPGPESPVGPSGRPDWFSRLESPATTPAAEPEPEQMEPPDWLSRLEPASGAQPPIDLEPAVPTPLDEAEAPDWLAEPAPSEGEIPDWLVELAPVEAEAAEAPLTEAEVPDWLAELAPADAEAAETPPSEAEVPDWLIELAPAEAEPAEAPPGEAEVPDWLTELAPAEAEAAETPLTEAAVPDWLAELAPAEAEATETPLGEAAVPDWLTELAPAEAATTEAPLTEAEVPDWLAELAPAEAEPPETPLIEAEVPDWLAELAPAEGEVPDWLAEMMSDEAESTEALPSEGEAPDRLAEPTEAPLTEAEVPDWLAELAPAEGEPAEAPLTEAEVSDWLVEPTPAEGEPAETPLTEAAVPDWLAEPTEAPPTEMELPDWLKEPTEAAPVETKVPDWLMSAPAPEPLADAKEALPQPLVEAGPTPEESGLVQAEIPEWLQAMRPHVIPPSVSKEEDVEVETSGLLAGIAGVIQPASAVAALPSAPTRPERIGTEAALARARLWQELIARSTQPSALELPRVRTRGTRDRIERWLVYGIVLLAVLIPLLAGMDLSNVFVLDEPLTSEAGTAFDLVDETVTEGTPVLIVFDYDPAYMGELHPLGEALLHQMARKRARIITLSLTPEGAGLAQQLMDDVLTGQGFQSGQDYVNLGYLPGEAAGIRFLEFLPRQFKNQTFDGKDFEDALVFASDEGFALSRMSLIVVLTGDSNDLRWWIEQVTALEKDLDKDLPLVAGVSAAIEPLVRPYYDAASQQIDGLVVGLSGAVDYERELNWLDGPAHVRVSGQIVGQLAVVAIIVMGILIHGLPRRGDSVA